MNKIHYIVTIKKYLLITVLIGSLTAKYISIRRIFLFQEYINSYSCISIDQLGGMNLNCKELDLDIIRFCARVSSFNYIGQYTHTMSPVIVELILKQWNIFITVINVLCILARRYLLVL